LLSDGTLLSDSYLASAMSKPTADAIALAALAGDQTAGMAPVIDANPDH